MTRVFFTIMSFSFSICLFILPFRSNHLPHSAHFQLQCFTSSDHKDSIHWCCINNLILNHTILLFIHQRVLSLLLWIHITILDYIPLLGISVCILRHSQARPWEFTRCHFMPLFLLNHFPHYWQSQTLPSSDFNVPFPWPSSQVWPTFWHHLHIMLISLHLGSS